MKLNLALFTLIGALAFVSCAVDVTLQKEAKGSSVVEATINKIKESCIFPVDHLFLRRMAAVLTDDGNDPSTYRQGFDGGIWQVTRQEFELTQSSASLKSIRDKITTNSPLGVQYSFATWSDLRTPLYSGIAAMLTYIRLSNNQIPSKIEAQAALYAKIKGSSDPNAANNFDKKAQAVDIDCASSNLDLAVLIDTSSSLAIDDFKRSLNFVSQLVSNLKIGTNDVRVAFVTYSSGYRIQFDFNKYSSVADLQKAIKSTQYVAGGTDTDQALAYAANTLFTSGSGSRNSAAKVALLITDGASDDSLAASNNAKLLRQKGVILFTIGIGSEAQNHRQELQDLSSKPTCTHFQELAKYSELDSITSEIKKVSCEAPVVLNRGNFRYLCGSRNIFRIDSRSEQSIVIRPQDGAVRIFGSYSTSNPSAARSDFNVLASPNQAVVIYIQYQSSPLYVAIQSDNSVGSRCTTTFSVDVVNRNSLRRDTKNVCAAGDSIYTCTTLDLLRARYTVTKTSRAGICQGNLPGFFPDPFDYTRFYYCDGRGNTYLVQCPVNNYYNDNLKDCAFGQPPTSPTTTTTTTTTTPKVYTSNNWYGRCTQNNYDLGIKFFPYPPDPHKFIKCAEWPLQGSILNCPPNKKWLQSALTCVYEKVVTDVSKQQFLTSPLPRDIKCIAGHTDPDDLYHIFPCDNTKYYQCDPFGDSFVQTCPPKQIWHQDIKNCIPGVAKRTC